jgi:hypothetical protein
MMQSKSEQIFEYVVFIVARLLFGSDLAMLEIYQRIIRQALMCHGLHTRIADILLDE